MAKKTNFFPHDSNARNDEKLIRLRMKHGAAGYGVYFMLLERMRDEADYAIACDYDMLAFDFHVESELVRSVAEDFGLFDIDGDTLFSHSFQERMRTMGESSKKRSDAGKKGATSRWHHEETTEVEDDDNSADGTDVVAEPQKELPESPYIPMLLQNEEWQQIICMRYHKKREEIPKLVEEFELDCRCRGKVHFSLQDAQSHFANWLSIQISEQQKQENYGNKKRKPNKNVAESAEEFVGTF